MMNQATRLKSALLLVLAFCIPALLAAEESDLLVDPGFELRLPPEQGGWTLFERTRFSSDEARTGEGSMLNSGFSRNVAFPPFLLGNASGAFQEFPAAAGSRWRLTGFGMTTSKLKGLPAFGILQLSFFDDDGKDLGTVETAGDGTTRAKTSNEVNARSNVDEWIFLDTGIATAPEGTVAVQAFTLYVDFSGANTAQGVHFDDLTLCKLEEDDEDGSRCPESGSD